MEVTLAGFHLREKGEKVALKNWFMVISVPERLIFTGTTMTGNKN